jgi:hypothetical protein
MKNTDHQEIQFNEHADYSEMTTVVYKNGHTYDLENSEDYRVELREQKQQIDKLHKALTDALECMEDADMQLAERTIRRALGEKV